MGLEEFPVGVVKVHALSSQLLEFSGLDQDRDWLPAARQLNRDTRFGLVDDSWASGSGVGDRVRLRHDSSYNLMYTRTPDGEPHARH
jgi:hypothetical protein